jgi:hypothetical protein
VSTQPYPAGTQWRFRYRKDQSIEHTTELVLYAEPDACWITDDYLVSEITPRELWDKWIALDIYQDPARTQVHISWYVTTPDFTGTFEGAPFQQRDVLGGELAEHFLKHFTWPEHVETGERVNWLRLPVADRGWNEQHGHKGGFIQELLGWKPSPLQPLMNVPLLAMAAGLD